MRIGKALRVRSKLEWRRWLAQHHKDRKEVWLVFYKKSSRKTMVTYDDAVEEALCYGWIDGQTRGIDEEKYALRFTPRREKSVWSKSNKARALKMLLDGKMTQAGKASLPAQILRSGKDS